MRSIQIENEEEFIQNCIDNSEVDIDDTFCEDAGFKFDNHEVDAEKIDLLPTEINKKSFKFIFPQSEIN